MMTQEMLVKLKKSLIKHEGCSNFPYFDEIGKITIGIGFNLTDRGVTDEWIAENYTKDVDYFYNILVNIFDWFKDLNEDRKIILVDMCFMGFKHFLSFKKMIDALSKGDYKTASYEMLDSKWAKQDENKAGELAQGMLTGIYNI
jgi:lysozyme